MKLLTKFIGVMLALALPVGAFAQNVTVKGQVKDANGEPMIVVNVAQVGTTNGTVTDMDGNYSISVPSNSTLRFSFMGYQTKEVAVAGKTTINVTLEEDTELLDEVVVIGYGVQKKSDLTGAVASVRAESLKQLSTTDAAAALQGKVSGINVINNGAPGSGSEIRVRGISSNGGNISPLFIVDGLQVSSIQYLDPSMIESIEILKDAASAAIYGAQAGNGVVLVTTKVGDESKASINYTSKFTRQDYTKRPMMDRKNFLEYKRQEMGSSIVDAELARFDYSNPDYEGGVIDTDWIGAYLEPSWSKQHSISVSGGNKSGHYFTSVNFVNDNGVVKGDKDVYKRLTAQINADYNIFKWFQIGTTNSIEKWSTKSVSQRGYTSSFEQMLLMDPLTPVYWKTPDEMSIEVKTAYDAVQNGSSAVNYRFIGDENGWFANTKYSDMEGSALAKRDISDGTSEGFNINGTLYANLMPVKGLTVTSRLGYRINQNSSHSYQSPYYIGGRGSSETYSISASTTNGYYYQWENFANYNLNIGKNSIAAMAGMSYRETNSDAVSVSSTGKDILKDYAENFRYISYLKDDASKTVSNAPSKSASMAYYGRLTYSYDNRYSVQANFRADAFDSSKLSKDKRWGYFPSVSAGWTVSNESFFKDQFDASTFSFLKVRASWGRNGNISVLSGYPYASTISIGSSWYQYGVGAVGNGSTYGSAPGGLANPNLHWEISEQVDLGLDARFLDNRLTLGFDYYNKHTKDLLFSVSTPPELGVSSVMSNGGNVLNRGIELELGWRDRVGEINYSVSANITTLHNEVISLAEGAAPEYKTDASSTNYKIRNAFEKGYSVWYLNGFKYAGMDAEGYPTYYGFDAEGNEVVKSHTEVGDGDMQFIGNSTPTYQYGLNVTVDYKGFDFTLNGYGQGGNSILPVLHRTGFKNNLQYYKDEMESGNLPSADKVFGDYVFWSSTANLFKGDYFRVKTLQLGYSLPSKLTKKAAISNLRLYVSLDDFFTITKYPGLDPETASTNSTTGAGLDWGSYPTMKKFIFGVNLTF